MSNKLEKCDAGVYLVDENQTREETRVPKVKFLPSGAEVEVPAGKILLDAALDNNVRINHNCGGNCACSTCHVYIEQGYEALNEMSEDEQDMLDEVENLQDNSRLACQCKVISDLIVRIPQESPLRDDD